MVGYKQQIQNSTDVLLKVFVRVENIVALGEILVSSIFLFFHNWFNSLPNKTFLDWNKFKVFADNK